MFENWQKLVSTEKLFILFLRITLLHKCNLVLLLKTSKSWIIFQMSGAPEVGQNPALLRGQ